MNHDLFSGLPPPALQALCKLIAASEAGEQLINRVRSCTTFLGERSASLSKMTNIIANYQKDVHGHLLHIFVLLCSHKIRIL